MQQLRLLLYPFSVLYDGVTSLRNWAFDQGWLAQEVFDIPVIAVGNLSTGGTGKTPMVEYVVAQALDQKVAVLSRGYGRATKGYIELNKEHTAVEVGDEPLQIKRKFGDQIISAVCEKRSVGIKKLRQDHDLDLIILDDAFQHRHVKASHYILLTSYGHLYTDDFVLPAGNLRESSRGAGRAHSVVVTKCPPDLDVTQRQQIRSKLSLSAGQKLYFSTIQYDTHIYNEKETLLLAELKIEKLTVVTGIANPAPFIAYLEQFYNVRHLKFADHHHFSDAEIAQIAQESVVLTTEKDYRRLEREGLSNLYYLPITTSFLGPALAL